MLRETAFARGIPLMVTDARPRGIVRVTHAAGP